MLVQHHWIVLQNSYNFSFCCCVLATTRNAIISELLQWHESFRISFYFLIIFLMLCPLSVRNTPCLHYFSLYTLGSFLRHVKNVRLHVSLVPQTSHVVFSLQVSSLHVLILGSFPFASWGWFWVKFNSILGLFESLFVCRRLHHKNLRAI